MLGRLCIDSDQEGCTRKTYGRLLCDPCLERREKTGAGWFKRLIKDTKERYPDANIDGKKALRKDGKMTKTEVKAQEKKRVKKVYTSWNDD